MSGAYEPGCRSSGKCENWRCSISPSTASCGGVIWSLYGSMMLPRNGHAIERTSVRQRKIGRPVRFELTEQTRQTIDEYLADSRQEAGGVPVQRAPAWGEHDHPAICAPSSGLAGRGSDSTRMSTARTLRRTKATLIYRRTGNLRAVQLLLGHTKIESTVRYLGIDIDDALAISEQVEI